MRWSDLLATSLASLRQRFFRTFLTVLGVTIGTTAVVVMVSLGVGMSDAMMQSMDSVTLRQVTVAGLPQQQGGVQPVDPSMPSAMDEALRERLAAQPGVEVVIPVFYASAQARVGAATSYLQILGVPAEALSELDMNLAWGTSPEPGAPLGLLVGDQVGTTFYDMVGNPGSVDLQTQSMFLTFEDGGMGMPVGPQPTGDPAPAKPPKKFIVSATGMIAGNGQQWGPNSTMVYADIDSLRDAMEKAYPGKALPGQPAKPDGSPKPGFVYNEFRLLTADAEAAELVLADLKAQGYQVYAAVEFIQEMQRQAAMVQAVFGGIGFISLFVAAIGIANTMMMSVYERTKEIGVMKVLGAALRDIRSLFLMESASIGLLGGLLGLGLSIAVSTILNATLGQGGGLMGMPGEISVIPLWLMVGAVAFATAIGTVAGIVPAQRAMRLSPLAAIRSE